MVKVGPKVQTLGSYLFYENSDSSNLFQTITDENFGNIRSKR